MHKLIVVVIVAVLAVGCGVAKAESEPDIPTETQIIEELYDRIEALEERLAAQEAICEIVEVSSDFTTMTVRREVGGEEIDYEGVINTFTTYAGGGVQYQKLDVGDSVLVRFASGRAYTVALMPSIGDVSEGVVTRYDVGGIANGTFSSNDGITNRVFGDDADAEMVVRVPSGNPDAVMSVSKDSGVKRSIARVNFAGDDQFFVIQTINGQTTASDPNALLLASISNGIPGMLLKVTAKDINDNVMSVALNITATGATLIREDQADSSNDKTINLFSLTP